VEDLLTANSSDGGSVWTRLANIPTPGAFSPTTLRGHVMAIGGVYHFYGSNPTGAAHCYDVATNSWSVAGKMPTPRFGPLIALFPGNQLAVVGGELASGKECSITEICNCDIISH
jgi:hypothetical protein